MDGPSMPARKPGRNNGNAPRNGAKPGKPSHARRPHAQRGKEEHSAGNKRRSKWRGNANSRKA
jgi:hypothetical protein